MRVSAVVKKRTIGARSASEAGQLHVLSGMKYQQTCHVQAAGFLFRSFGCPLIPKQRILVWKRNDSVYVLFRWLQYNLRGGGNSFYSTQFLSLTYEPADK